MYQQENYSLEIISRHTDFNGKNLKKYKLEGIDTIGAWGNEPFEIQFKNHTWQKLQVKLSLDGTDILTGDQATSEPSGKMWVVNGKETLTLKAWPETNNGGAGFVFTSGDKSVALHTHGDMSHRGIIAAAVFTESHIEPTIKTIHHNNWTYDSNILRGYSKGNAGSLRSRGLTGTAAGSTYSSNSIPAFQANNISDSISFNASDSRSDSGPELQSLASVGAGSYTEQQITYTKGLVKPLLTDTVRVKYVWWDDLVSALRTAAADQPHPSGFPGDKPLMSIGSTPRYDTREQRQALRTKLAQEQLQFARF